MLTLTKTIKHREHNSTHYDCCWPCKHPRCWCFWERLYITPVKQAWFKLQCIPGPTQRDLRNPTEGCSPEHPSLYCLSVPRSYLNYCLCLADWRPTLCFHTLSQLYLIWPLFIEKNHIRFGYNLISAYFPSSCQSNGRMLFLNKLCTF